MRVLKSNSNDQINTAVFGCLYACTPNNKGKDISILNNKDYVTFCN